MKKIGVLFGWENSFPSALMEQINARHPAGVLRAQVLESAGACGLAVHECALRAPDLAAAEELFLTNALIGIRPVRELAGAAVALGPVTRALQAQLAREVPGFADE